MREETRTGRRVGSGRIEKNSGLSKKGSDPAGKRSGLAGKRGGETWEWGMESDGRKAGNTKTRNTKTRNTKTGNAKTGNAKTGNVKAGNVKTGNAYAGVTDRGAKKETVGAKWNAGKPGRGGKNGNGNKTASMKPGGSPARGDKRPLSGGSSPCPAFRQCGSCQYLDIPYGEQLKIKQKELQKLLGGFCKVHPIHGMEDPFHYRNKVHAVFGHRKGEIISGVYEAGTHNLVPVETCMIEDQKSDEIIGTIRTLLKSFKIKTYDEDTGYGLLRHVLIRRGFATGEIMVVLVTASPVFPSKNNFVKALRERHPEITTIVQNLNGRGTSMVLGDKEHVLYGKGYIEDVLCGCRFRISSRSFYQVNPVQTEYLYGKAIELAGLTGTETVLDAYCGIGTIGIIASRQANMVIGVELNQDAVRDAIQNAKCNEIKNIRFFCNDATRFMTQMAGAGDTVDVVLMDPPRSGSTEAFIEAVAAVKAKTVVYVSCGPDTLARDLAVFRRFGYEAKGAWGVDLFPMTAHCETVVKLSRKIKV